MFTRELAHLSERIGMDAVRLRKLLAPGMPLTLDRMCRHAFQQRAEFLIVRLTFEMYGHCEFFIGIHRSKAMGTRHWLAGAALSTITRLLHRAIFTPPLF